MLLGLFLFFLGANGVLPQCIFSGANNLELHCKNVDMQEVNRVNQLGKLQQISINGLNDAILSNNALNTPNLEELTIASGSLRLLQTHTFATSQKIKRLCLQNNSLTRLPNDLFTSLPELRELNLSHNRFSELTLDTFYDLRAIQILDLSYNRIEKLILGLTDQFPTTQKLYLNNNKLTSLELGVLDSLKNVVLLDFSCNKINETLPLGLFDAPNKIEVLLINGNRFRKLELGVFDSLLNLHELSLGSKTLSEVPLGLLNNNLKLKSIDLGGSPNLGQFPLYMLHRNSELQKINLSDCSLREIPERVFDNNSKLEEVDLSYNKLEKLPRFLFAKNRNLKYFNVSHNAIKILHMAFFQATVLKVIDISYNEFGSIQPELLSLSTIQGVYARNNQIDYLDPTTFATNGFPLQYLDVRQNRLVFLEDEFFEWVINLKQLEIGGNPWDCKCFDKILGVIVHKKIMYEELNNFDGTKPVCVTINNNLTKCNYDKTTLAEYYKEFAALII